MRTRTRYLLYTVLVLILLVAGFLFPAPPLLAPVIGQQPARQDVAIDPDDIGGVVTGPNGPEAGVWVIAETRDLPVRFIRSVVTDDQGRYVVPDLPKANYSVWARKGVKVVCVDARPLPGYERFPFMWPSERQVYTVRSTFWNERRGHWQLRLAELENPVLPWLDGTYEPALSRFGSGRRRSARSGTSWLRSVPVGRWRHDDRSPTSSPPSCSASQQPASW